MLEPLLSRRNEMPKKAAKRRKGVRETTKTRPGSPGKSIEAARRSTSFRRKGTWPQEPSRKLACGGGLKKPAKIVITGERYQIEEELN